MREKEAWLAKPTHLSYFPEGAKQARNNTGLTSSNMDLCDLSVYTLASQRIVRIVRIVNSHPYLSFALINVFAQSNGRNR